MCANTNQEEAQVESRQEVVSDKIQLQHELTEERRGSAVVPATPEPLKQDILAYITAKHKQGVEYVCDKLDTAFGDPRIRVLTKTTQPVHVIAVAAVSVVAYVFLSKKETYQPRQPSAFANLLYIVSVSIHVGAQFWMTFISGLALYFALPRHVFGDVQKVLFPKYFTLNSILSVITLISFSKLHRGIPWETRHWVQMWSNGICFLVEVFIRLYMVPIVLRLISAKVEIEKKLPGCGTEVGRHDPGELVKCPHYKKLHKNFRQHHLVVALGNVTTMVCTTLQLHYIHQNWSCAL